MARTTTRSRTGSGGSSTTRENGFGEVAVEVPSVDSISNLGRVIGDGNAKKLVVNLSTGITHPSDEASAVQLFRILRTGRVPSRPEEVKAIAVHAGWEPRHDRDLASVAERIPAGKVVQARGGTMWSEDILDQWRVDALDQG
jgi:hypothetical protein